MNKEKSIVFDLDDTICFPNHEFSDTERKYKEAKPNIEVIKKMNELYDKGFYVKIYSSRRMVTHNGDLEKIHEDVLEPTTEWLKDNDVKYNELIFGKEYSSTYYVDDKAMKIDEFLERDLNDF